MKQIITFIISALVATSAIAQSLVPLHVEGNKFKNANNETVILRGLCYSDPVKLIHDGHWNEEYFAQAADWGANIVRFAVHPENINQLGWERTFEAMDQGIQWAGKYGMYVIMDWHSIGNLKDKKFTNKMYDTDLGETFRFWRTVSKRYRNQPTVALYELFNEPTIGQRGLGKCSWSQWRSINEQIIDTIRTYNPDAICLCAGFNWAYDLTPVAKEPIRRQNVAYVAHPYPMKRDQPWVEQWERDWGYVADTYPVVCTEIGYCLENEKGSHIPVISTDVYGEEITRYLDQKGISFTVWCFDPDWGPMLISDWKFTLTTSGRFFKKYMQEQHASATRQKIEIKLWPNGAPNSNEITEPEEGNPQFVTKVTQPVLTIYLPKHPNGLALLACPGGSYLQVWQGTEGHNMAEWYNEQGLVYAVLKYRLPNGHNEVPLSDVHEAMHILKEHQAEYGFTKLGIQGCSAGGHLASTAATHFTSPENRPDFQILFYPVISFDPAFTHMLSRESLIGQNPSAEMIELYCNEKQVKQDTPPALIIASTDDGLVPVRNSIEYGNALMQRGISTTMLLYPIGGHGWFGNTAFPYRQAWLEATSVWLKGLIEK